MTKEKKFNLKDFNECFEVILRDKQVKTVTLFCSPLSNITQRIRMTRRKKSDHEITVTFGKPNYAEREFIRICKKSNKKPTRLLIKNMNFPKKGKNK